jgi:hypothetical protein
MLAGLRMIALSVPIDEVLSEGRGRRGTIRMGLRPPVILRDVLKYVHVPALILGFKIHQVPFIY